MSQATLILPDHGPSRHAPRALSTGAILLAAAAVSVVASLLTTLLVNKGPALAAMPAVPVVQGVAAADGLRGAQAAHATHTAPLRPLGEPGTTVPDARTVFAGHDTPIEEPIATF